MADKSKQIVGFSYDAINTCKGLQRLTKKQKNAFKENLNILSSHIKKEKQRLDDKIFREHILIQIETKIGEAEEQATDGMLTIEVENPIYTNYEAYSIEEMLGEHTKLVQEEAMKAWILIHQFSRGLLYLQLAEKLKQDGRNLREFTEKGNLSVCFTSVRRYIALAKMILKYPRLILCQLTFTKLIKHRTRLLNYLSQLVGCDLDRRLSIPFEIITNGQIIQISNEGVYTLTTKFNSDPVNDALEIRNPEDGIAEMANVIVTPAERQKHYTEERHKKGTEHRKARVEQKKALRDKHRYATGIKAKDNTKRRIIINI